MSSTNSGGAQAESRWPGEHLGLPETGSGSVAGTGRRLLGFVLDIVLAGLVAGLFTAPELPQNWSLLAWAVITVVPAGLFGFTPGMLVSGIWVARLDGAARLGLWRALVRCALTLVLVPAIIRNKDARSWLDRLTSTVVVRR